MLNNWRLILDPACSGALNMATDSALLGSASTAQEPSATLRLYSWSTPTISIGYRQDPAQFKMYNLPVVRRVTGGRAVLHDSELTYSITVPKSNPLYGTGISGAYASISRCLVSALKDVGVKRADFMAPARPGEARQQNRQRSGACFLSSSRYEIIVDGKKMVGSAQRRFAGAFLQHGSILTGIDPVALESVFGAGIIDKITWLSAHTQATAEQLRIALVSRVGTELGVKLIEAPLTESERRAVDKEQRKGNEETHCAASSTGCAPLIAL